MMKANIQTPRPRLMTAILGLTLCVLVFESVKAQTTNTDGTTPLSISPGAPAGSYPVSGFENVNLYNGNLNFSLLLLRIGGRGAAGYTMTLPIEQRWRVETLAETPPNSTPIITPVGEWWGDLKPGYGPGVLQGRRTGDIESDTTPFCNPSFTAFDMTLTRLTFTTPDGTEIELRDTNTGGVPQGYPDPCIQTGFSRGTDFISADGSNVTFISDTPISDSRQGHLGLSKLFYPSGYLMMKDGTRYRIESGLVKWTRDRNGNYVTFVYTNNRVTTITDSIGRQVTVSYAVGSTTYDTISFKGFKGDQRTIKVWRTNLENALRSDFQLETYHDLFPLATGASEIGEFNASRVSAVELPDGRQYELRYNSHGELARVKLPTGGAFEYDWVGDVGQATEHGIIRRVAERRVYENASNFETKTTYSLSVPANTEITVETKDASNHLLGKSIHYFYGHPSVPDADAFYSWWQGGREHQTESFDIVNGSPVLKSRVNNTYQQPQAGYSWPLTQAETSSSVKSNNPQITETQVTLVDTSQVSKQTFAYDQYGNRTDVYEYDFGSPTPARRTQTVYLTSSNYTGTGVYLRALPISQKVYDSAGVERARTTFEYDDYSGSAGHAGLTGRTDIIGLCLEVNTSNGSCTTASSTSYTTRGNLTRTSRWLLGSTATEISSYAQYDIAGNVVKAVDALGNETSLSYTDNFNLGDPDGDLDPDTPPTELGTLHSFAFVTSAENELGHIAYSQYDYHLGAAVDAKDANGLIASGFYDDDLDRPTKVIIADNISALRQQKTFDYDDIYRIITVTGDLRDYNDNALKNQTFYDGLGRTTETRVFENSTDYISTKQVPFDVQEDTSTNTWRGVSRVSNPYRPQQSEEPLWTTTMSDALGRSIRVTTPDDAVVKMTYLGNATTVEDQAGKQRKSITDALGRLTSVYEAPNDTTNFNFQTSYVYDILGNLRTVTQGSQKRYFFYDSLSRLIRARNPELNVNTPNLDLSSDSLTDNNSQWSLSYSYDNNGNLLTKTDARGTSASYSYDGLNRVTQRTYSGGTAVATPTVTYTYDATSVSYSKGRLTSVNSSVSAYNYTGYDALGRVTASQQVTDGQTYSMSYQYDLVGNMTSQTYPTGRVVTQSFDNVGRLANISGQASGGTPKTYANSFGYTAHGAVERMRLGNGRWEHTNFNDRLQPTEIGLGSSATDSSTLKLNYEYGDETNNGNVLKQVITVPTIGTATGFIATQHYQYDQLNRLTGAQEVNGTSSEWQSSGTLWQQKFGYDRFGNRAVDTANTTSSMIGPNPQISTSNNRIVPRTSPVEYYDFDAAGNMKTGQGGDIFAYDAENKLVQYEGGATQTGGADYFYDGDGRRVKKARPSETLIFVYNIKGQLVAEYTTSTPENNGTSYLTSDTLGTPRALTKAEGSIRARHDYLPFGEELYADTGSRTTDQGYIESLAPEDTTRQKFTQYERDSETGLDYAQARYYASVQGRFTSPDPLIASARIRNPQTWNRYSYVLNNPLKFIDPEGLQDTLAHELLHQDLQKKKKNPAKPRERTNPVNPDAPVPGSASFSSPFFSDLNDPKDVNGTQAAYALLVASYGQDAESVYDGWTEYEQAVFLNTVAALEDAGLQWDGVKFKGFVYDEKLSERPSNNAPYGIGLLGVSNSNLDGADLGAAMGGRRSPGRVETAALNAKPKGKGVVEFDIDLYNGKVGSNNNKHLRYEVNFNSGGKATTHPADVTRALNGRGVRTGVTAQ